MNNKTKIQRTYHYNENNLKTQYDHFLRQTDIITDSFMKNALAAIKNNPADIYKYPGIIVRMPDRLKTLELCKIVFTVNPKYLYFIPERIQQEQEFIDLVINRLYTSKYYSIFTRDLFKYAMCDDLYEACQLIEEVNNDC